MVRRFFQTSAFRSQQKCLLNGLCLLTVTEDFCLQIWASLEWVVWNIPAVHNGSYAWCWPKVGRCDETCLLFPTCFWFLERPLCVLAQGLNEPICGQIIIIIIRWPVSGSRGWVFIWWKCGGIWRVPEGTGWLCDRVESPHVDEYPKRTLCGALGSAWLLQWLVFVKALKDFPVPRVWRFHLSICLFCHNWALFAAEVEHRYHQNVLCWFLNAD